jgi:GTPase Era involved in 16S rRNA processing
VPVYLDAWVKVLPQWRKQPAALTRFGFPEPPTAGRRSGKETA